METQRKAGWIYVYWKQLAIALVLSSFLYFVWPTPYEYTRQFPSVIRVNRFSGVEELSSASGWRVQGGIAGSASGNLISRFEVITTYFEKSTYGSPWGYAELKNIGGVDLEGVRFDFSALDEYGVVVCTSYDFIADFRAGDTVRLKMYESDFQKCTSLRLDKVSTMSFP